MSRESGGEGHLLRPNGRYRVAAVTLGFVLVCSILALSLSASVAAQEADSEPPVFANATKSNLTTIQVTITDDVDVDESSIDASDFTLDPGSVEKISVNESGNDSVVDVHLASIVASGNVTVGLADGAVIRDVAGNELTDGSTVVSGMDGYRPQLQDLEVTRLNETAANVTVVSSEPLSELNVGIGGPGTDGLTIENFTRLGRHGSFRFPYRATVTFDEEGEYDVLVGTLIDENGVQSRYRVERTVVVDRTPPNARIAGPASASAGTPVTFDGTGSTDEFGVEGYNWSVDGNATGTGETFEHTFHTPGYHEVTLSARDGRGNVDTTSSLLMVESETTTEDVEVSARNASAATATVGPNRSVGRVELSADGGLVATDDVRLESLVVDVPVNTSENLSFTATPNASEWFSGTDATALAGFDVGHEDDLSTATFRFSVNRTALANASVDPEDVTLYREVDGGRAVYTAIVDESDGRVTYEATAAGLSRFVVGGAGGETTTDDGDGQSGDAETGTNDADGDDGEPDGDDVVVETGSSSIRVANSTLLTESLDAGDRLLVRATARNDGNATGTSVVGLVVNNSVVTTTPVTVPAGENRTVTFAEPVDEGGTVVVNGTIAGTLSVSGTNGSVAASGGGLSIPNPLALWPGGFFGRALGAIFWFTVILYAVLKGLAIYLGY